MDSTTNRESPLRTKNYIVSLGEKHIPVELIDSNKAEVDGQEITYNFSRFRSDYFSLIINGVVHEVGIQRRVSQIHGQPPVLTVHYMGNNFDISVDTPLTLQAKALLQPQYRKSTTHEIVAPMAGLVVRINTKPGDLVEAGQGLLVLEAMKMENEIKAPFQGSIQAVHISTGLTVEKGARLLALHVSS